MLRAHLLKRFELYVALMAGGFVGLVMALVWADASAPVSIGTTAVSMGLILGSIQWADRERQRNLRAQAIAEIREMLTDQVLNQLAAVKMWMAEAPDPEALSLILEETNESLDRVADMISGLSEAKLNTWRLTYANVADHITYSSEPTLASGQAWSDGASAAHVLAAPQSPSER
ncbi:MAG: hypothetical protein AAF845_15945 [Bacteroidota bacterium]